MATQDSLSSKDILPKATEKDVIELLSTIYGLTCNSVNALNGYEDQNFHVKISLNEDNDYISEVKRSGYVFKVMNTEDTEHNLNHIDGEITVLTHLLECGIVCPRFVRDKQGRYYSIQSLITGDNPEPRKHAVRLSEYIEGDILIKGEITPEMWHDAGDLLTQIHKALENFSEPRLTKKSFIWELLNFLDVEPFIKYAESKEHRILSYQVIEKWREIQPDINELEHVIIHSDFNEQNIIISRKEDGSQHVKGVIDFSDSGIAPRAFDVGTFLAYVMIVTIDKEMGDPLNFIKPALRGYLSKIPFTESELRVTYYSIAARLVTSCSLGEFMYSKYKNPYLLTTPRPGWKALKILWSQPVENLVRDWRAL